LRTLGIDLETYSSEDIRRSGLYRYVQSPDFEILLFAYRYDGGPVQIVDLKQGETLPHQVVLDLKDPQVAKTAFNAAFEYYCLSRYYVTPLEQWHCSMVHAWYCGYAGSLDAVGKAMQFPEDRRKMAEGKALVRYFCSPCAPTKRNGGRTRNLPGHAPEKWQLFKEYCIQDVVAEREIGRRLEPYPVPEQEHRLWVADQEISIRGVALDMELVDGALAVSAHMTEELSGQARDITGLDNPNSVAQLKQWVRENADVEIDSLNKQTVAELLEADGAAPDVRRVLEIRQELAKTSVKKYGAMEAAVCRDGRVRGLLQFYGGQRTGRWAGRLVQVQNLPRNHTGSLDTARELVKKKKVEALRTIYGNVPDTLSQLIRTSFIAPAGHKLVDADFSSIEARVISWLAGEQWRLEVFRTHGKIYEASASQMFGVPLDKIKKGNPEYALRQRGKVAELALGYQGSVGALIAMGALDMGIPEADLPDIVSRWRESNKRIVDLWYSIESAAVSVIQTGHQAGVNGLLFQREFDLENDLDFLTITLPSRRKLFYARPELGMNQWGRPSITYYGVNQTTKQWTPLETYGGKLVENCVQAIARDCLAAAIEHLEAAGFPVVFHVHDECVIDCPESQADLDAVVKIMTRPIPWARGLPLNADGWVGDFFRKD